MPFTETKFQVGFFSRPLTPYWTAYPPVQVARVRIDPARSHISEAKFRAMLRRWSSGPEAAFVRFPGNRGKLSPRARHLSIRLPWLRFTDFISKRSQLRRVAMRYRRRLWCIGSASAVSGGFNSRCLREIWIRTWIVSSINLMMYCEYSELNESLWV